MSGTQPLPHCPRCQYDQSGVITSWTESCPLTGTCSECGLAFSWGDLLSGKLTPPPWWSVERDSSKWLLKIPLHWFAMFFPKRTWTGVRMEHPVRFRRLALLMLVSMMLAHLIAASQVCMWRYEMVMSVYNPAANSSKLVYVLDLIWPHRAVSDGYDTWDFRNHYHPFRGITAAPALFLMLSPLVLFLLPESRARAKVHRNHIFRAGAYTFALTPVATALATWAPHLTDYVYTTFIGDQSGFGFRYSLREETLLWARSVSLCLVALFALLWWYRIASRYMKLRHPFSVALAIVLVALFTTSLILIVVWNDQLVGVFMRWDNAYR